MHSDETQILDLTDKQTLFELAVDEDELLGEKGLKLIDDLKEKATEAEYTHIYYRDPNRPGVVWFASLHANEIGFPTRGKLDECRSTVETVFPGFLKRVSEDMSVEAMVPPITTGVKGIDLVTSLEYLVFLYPRMVRAWAALSFSYTELMQMKFASEAVFQECIVSCPEAQLVPYLLGHSYEGTG